MDMQAVKLHIDERIEAGLLPGAVCGVFLDGRPVFTYVSGYADVEKKIPLKENAVFRLASMTKPVTAAAALLCEDRGLLHIEDKVSRYLPAFSHMKVGRMENGRPIEAGEASREITLYDVLTHSSGWALFSTGRVPCPIRWRRPSGLTRAGFSISTPRADSATARPSRSISPPVSWRSRRVCLTRSFWRKIFFVRSACGIRDIR